MPAPVPGQERDAHALQCPDDKRIRRAAERRLDSYFFNVFQLRHLVQPAAADDTDLCCGHKLQTILCNEI
jgi:hypothetical protein